MKQFGVEPGNLKQQVKDAVGAPQMTDENVTNIATAAQQYLQSSRTPQDRQQLSQMVAQNSGKSPQEIDPMIQKWEQKYDETKQQAYQGAEKAANVTGTTAIVLALVMFIGLIAASIGAAIACGPFCEKHVHTT
jgi:CHASE3 domain sensor protein